MGFFVWLVFTALWGGIGGVLPFFLPAHEHLKLVQMMIRTTAILCYSMWLITYWAQTNPLFGPQLSNSTMMLMKKEWS